jgi:hypothetical protein
MAPRGGRQSDSIRERFWRRTIRQQRSRLTIVTVRGMALVLRPKPPLFIGPLIPRGTPGRSRRPPLALAFTPGGPRSC